MRPTSRRRRGRRGRRERRERRRRGGCCFLPSHGFDCWPASLHPYLLIRDSVDALASCYFSCVYTSLSLSLSLRLPLIYLSIYLSDPASLIKPYKH